VYNSHLLYSWILNIFVPFVDAFLFHSMNKLCQSIHDLMSHMFQYESWYILALCPYFMRKTVKLSLWADIFSTINFSSIFSSLMIFVYIFETSVSNHLVTIIKLLLIWQTSLLSLIHIMTLRKTKRFLESIIV
jgi:hypothetical protein